MDNSWYPPEELWTIYLLQECRIRHHQWLRFHHLRRIRGQSAASRQVLLLEDRNRWQADSLHPITRLQVTLPWRFWQRKSSGRLTRMFCPSKHWRWLGKLCGQLAKIAEIWPQRGRRRLAQCPNHWLMILFVYWRENKYQFYVFRCLAFSPTFFNTGFRSLGFS